MTNNILIIAASSSVAGRFPAVLVYKQPCRMSKSGNIPQHLATYRGMTTSQIDQSNKEHYSPEIRSRGFEAAEFLVCQTSEDAHNGEKGSVSGENGLRTYAIVPPGLNR